MREGQANGQTEFTDFTHLLIHHEPDVFDPHSTPEGLCSELRFRCLAPGWRLRLVRIPVTRHPPLSFTQAACPGRKSAFTQKPGDSPQATTTSLIHIFLSPCPLPSSALTGSVVSPQSLFPILVVLGRLSRRFLCSSMCSGSVTFDLCGLGQILNLWACFPHQENKNH